jgi:hypothetical protein
MLTLIDMRYQSYYKAKFLFEYKIIDNIPTKMDIATRLSAEGSIQFNGKPIACRLEDGYINATQLCYAGDKLFHDWSRRVKAEEFLNELSNELKMPIYEVLRGFPLSTLIKYIDNGPLDRATWVHPRVAINIAQWISAKFDVKVSSWIHELLVCGNVKYGNERADVTIMHEQMKQLENTIATRDGTIVEKDTKIDYLTQLITELGYDMKGIKLELTSTKDILIDTKQELTSTKDILIENTKTLEDTRHELRSTKNLVEDIVERCVPRTIHANQIEVYCLLKIRDNHYYCIRAQRKSINPSIKKYNTNNNVILQLVKEWNCAPNAIMLHNLVKDLLCIKRSHINVNRNDLELLPTCTEASLLRKIDRIYKLRY